MIWECKQCGKCCEQVERILPNFALKDGSCCHYDKESHLCKIYWERPMRCRVDEFYVRHMKYFMSYDRYYTQQRVACEMAQGKVKEE